MAAQHGYDGIVQLLLDNRADINARTSDEDFTALHYAASKGCEGIVQLLLDYGANVNAEDYKGHTPLLLALNLDHPKVTDLLLADPNINVGCVDPKSVSNEKAGKRKFVIKRLQDGKLFAKLKEAVNEKDMSKLDKLLKEIKELLESKTEYGFKPSLSYSPDGNDENTTIKIAIKAGGKLLQLLYDYAEKNIGTDTEIFKKLKHAKENSQSKGDLYDVSVLKHSTPDQGFLFSHG